ncbi:MAG: hypothetical protein PX635_00830 [Nostocales cyanobacterium LE14-WE12]|jgi:hypothetical protein|nr:hypothetical protein [Nostocales cyanobacterium LE14-WE12]
MKQLQLPLIDFDKVRLGQLQAENRELKKKIDFLQHSRSSYIGKAKNYKQTIINLLEEGKTYKEIIGMTGKSENWIRVVEQQYRKLKFKTK